MMDFFLFLFLQGVGEDTSETLLLVYFMISCQSEERKKKQLEIQILI